MDSLERLNDLPVNVFDIGVIAVLLVSALLAYARGFVHEVLSVAGWIGAILATFYGFPYLKPYARQIISIDLAADLAAGVVIFVVSLAALSVLSRSISRRVKDSALGALDRSLGFLFGLARGVLVVCIAYIGLELIIPRDDQPKWIAEARSMELVLPGADLLTSLIPETAGSAVSDAVGDAKEKANEAVEEKAKDAARELLSPPPKAPDDPDQGAYDPKERQDMERLIGTSQQQ